MQLDILFQDKHVVAIRKPAGLPVHRNWVDHEGTQFAVQLVRNQVGQWVYPIHRLDRPTSGVLLFGLSPEDARVVNGAFTQRRVQKTYLAIVRGYADESDVVDQPLLKRVDRLTDRRAMEPGKPQEAVTEYLRLATTELPYAVGKYPTARYSLVHIEPKTGRRHQIRRHFKHLAHPIIGDVNHGDRHHNHFFQEHFGCERMLLAATELVFPHPVSGDMTTVVSPLCVDYVAMIDALGWRDVIPTAWLLEE